MLSLNKCIEYQEEYIVPRRRKKIGTFHFKKWLRVNRSYLIAVAITSVYTLIMVGIIVIVGKDTKFRNLNDERLQEEAAKQTSEISSEDESIATEENSDETEETTVETAEETTELK